MIPEICKKFWADSFINPLIKTDRQNGKPAPDFELPFDENLLIALPNPKNIPLDNFNLIDFIENRKTVRNYADSNITINELSFMLWATQGLKEILSDGRSFRTVPSAGARHAFETLLIVNKVDDLNPGIYRYIVSKHKLLPLNFNNEEIENIISAFRNINLVANSAVTFLWQCIPHRMIWAFAERAFRYVLLDAGHVCQNLYLAAEAVNCGCCAIGAFDDEEINAALNFNDDSFLIYAATVGKKS